jgi:hypothetical protein
MPSSLLPPDIRVFERGWLSSNNILLLGQDSTALVDSGPGDVDAALQGHYPALRIGIPHGLAESVRHWDVDGLTWAPTGQSCPRYRFEAMLQPVHRAPAGGAALAGVRRARA